MNPILKNILAVIAGIVIGGIVNFALILVSPMVIAPPEGADVTTNEGLAATMHLFQAKHFIFPFLAHALGTLIGAVITATIAANRKQTFAIVIGLVFLIGGVMQVVELPAPFWFEALDLIFAYLPMGWLGYKLYQKLV